MDVRNAVSAHEVEAEDIMQRDNCQGDLVYRFPSWVIEGGADSRRLWRKLTGEGFQGERASPHKLQNIALQNGNS